MTALAGLASTEAGFERVGCSVFAGLPARGRRGDQHKTFSAPLSKGLSGDSGGKDMSVLPFEDHGNCGKESAKYGW